MTSSEGGNIWQPQDVLTFSTRIWENLGGSIERPPSGWYKLVHSATPANRACIVIDLRSGTFDHFTNVRIKTLVHWRQAFSEVADGFDPYFPPDRGITTGGRSNRIECELIQRPDWRDYVCRYLELCRDYWLSAAQ